MIDPGDSVFGCEITRVSLSCGYNQPINLLFYWINQEVERWGGRSTHRAFGWVNISIMHSQTIKFPSIPIQTFSCSTRVINQPSWRKKHSEIIPNRRRLRTYVCMHNFVSGLSRNVHTVLLFMSVLSGPHVQAGGTCGSLRRDANGLHSRQ